MTKPSLAVILAAATLCGATFGVQAQTVYRIVGPDGKVTFSDKPPASAEQGKIAGTGVGANVSAGGNGALPFELRKVVAKYPVTLYTTQPCPPCDAGRAMLTSRGIPFTERTVTTAEDSAYLQRLMGDSSLPALSVGSQRIKGFSSVEWSEYLDAADYPKASILSAGYKNTPPSPLVSTQKPTAPATKAEEKPAAVPAPSAPPAASPSNPAGIVF